MVRVELSSIVSVLVVKKLCTRDVVYGGMVIVVDVDIGSGGIIKVQGGWHCIAWAS
jgi:hypothetical protein